MLKQSLIPFVLLPFCASALQNLELRLFNETDQEIEVLFFLRVKLSPCSMG